VGSFEYVMVLVSIVIGLAITHVLNALAAAIHRVRGHGEPIRLDAVYLLWVAYVLTWLVSFWWFEFKFQEVKTEWSYGLYLFIITYAVGLFMLATILVPKGLSGVSDSYAYFMAGRKWYFGTFLALQALDVADSFLKGADWGARPAYFLVVGVYASAAIAGIASERRSVQLLAAGGAGAVYLVFTFLDTGVLGDW